jgi:uncharacterized OB-fold protein
VSDAPKTRFEPPMTEASGPFWEASREQRFVVQWCSDCEAPIFYPREVCPQCLGTNLEWRPSEGRGTVYAVSVQHKPANPMMADRVPYAVALVELSDGIRLMSNIIGCDPESVAVGQSVQVAWEPLSDGRHLPQFEPVQ